MCFFCNLYRISVEREWPTSYEREEPWLIYDFHTAELSEEIGAVKPFGSDVEVIKANVGGFYSNTLLLHCKRRRRKT